MLFTSWFVITPFCLSKLVLIMAANLPQAIDTKLQSVQKDINSHIDSKFTELSELLKCPQVGLIPPCVYT